ncbi:MAG: PrgI family protein [Candidatus Levyibacteriota bacterium]
MDNHPIPQDISSFQFKLIGNMTVRQFAYLASGVILGWIFYSLPLFSLIKYPLAFLSALSGIIFAFIPVEGRPFDTMILLFIKSLFAPNQYIYQKIGGQILRFDLPIRQAISKTPPAAIGDDRLQKILKTLPKTPPKNELDKKEATFLEKLSTLQAADSPPPTIPASAPSGPKFISMEEEKKDLPASRQGLLPEQKAKEDMVKEKKLEEEAQTLEKELEIAKTQPSNQKAADLQDQLNNILLQKQRLEEELLSLQKKLSVQKQDVFIPSTAVPKEETQNVRKISKQMGKSIGLPQAPDTANVIMGIIKDPRGNILPNILVEVKDKEENPVRAFKTNTLGQFASATPLQNGNYTILFEDPQGKNKFDAIEISANGEVLPVLEIISRDEREDLRKALFN